MTSLSVEYNLKDAFEVDYGLSKLPKMVRLEYDKLKYSIIYYIQSFKENLFKHYNGFRELFRLISSAHYVAKEAH